MKNLIDNAEMLETEGQLAQAIQIYADVIRAEVNVETRAHATFRLGCIYREWRELFAAQRFLTDAHQLNPENVEVRDALESLNLHFSQNREQVVDEMSRQNSDQIVSLFRIATGIKLIAMDKPVQAYPLMKSRTKIFPNAAVAKHLLTDIRITESERNSAIDFLVERAWLVNTDAELYTIADSGLYAFYMALAQLHVDNAAYPEALMCYVQAYWLDDSNPAPLYQQVICHANAEAWDEAVILIAQLPTEVPPDVVPVVYYTAVAESYHHVYQTTNADSDRQKVIEACEAVLRLNKKDKAISKRLALYQGKKRWWRHS